MSAFDPPPYIGKLISAINDGAKSAQLGAVAFVFIGLFLLATSFSATDEDLLIGKSISISQLGGVTVPVVLSFGFMPAIFLALHLYTLIRFDLLMQNLRHFEAELRAHVPLQRDRDRCLQLLANTEFIQAAVQPEASFVFRWTYRFMLAVFPVAVLLLVQLGSLRLQSHVVNIVHHITILLDILLLIWFFRRQRPSGDSVMRWLFRRGRFLLPAAVLAFNFAWCRVPSAEATTVGAGKQAESFLEVSLQPVDLLLCHHVGFGCRYLSVPGRTLVGKVWDNRTFVELRAGKPLDEDRRAAFEPLVLQNKRLRFADLSGSQFFNVDLTGADLRHARLHQAWMTQAKLDGAQLQGASLAAAQLQGASLDFAQLQGALLNGAYLQGASLRLAELQDARLVEAKLQGASLDGAQLQGASLDRAQLQGASLDEAQLQGAWLDGAGLQGALIAGAKIWRIRAPEAALDDAQLRDLEFSDAAPCPDWVQPDEACPNPRDWRSWIEEWTKSIPAGSRRDAAQRRLAVLTAVSAPAGAETAQGVWNTRPTPEPEAVAKRLGDLACGTDHAPHIARGILVQIRQEEPRNLGAHRQTLAARMLGDDCPGARGLTEDERSHLTNIAAGRR
ncbi:MAG: pentapeptide repeat-containing protein [Roseomonas sp.]|nr:pentapeptide repeat-containing protein [Roseomonas sp.]